MVDRVPVVQEAVRKEMEGQLERAEARAAMNGGAPQPTTDWSTPCV